MTTPASILIVLIAATFLAALMIALTITVADTLEGVGTLITLWLFVVSVILTSICIVLTT